MPKLTRNLAGYALVVLSAQSMKAGTQWCFFFVWNFHFGSENVSDLHLHKG